MRAPPTRRKIGPRNRPETIVLLGHDPVLIETRQWVLQSRGYHVVIVESVGDLEKVPETQHVSLLLLCQTVVPSERKAALALARTRWPECKHLAMEAELGRMPAGILGQLLHTQNGPAQLIARVGALLQSDGDPVSIS